MFRFILILNSFFLLNAIMYAGVFSCAAIDSFPTEWYGNWKGKMEIINHKGKVQEVPMALEIHPTDTAGVFKWHIVYGEDRAAGLRPYLLRTIDATKGHYQTDELNGIKMDTYLLGKKMICTFIVKESMITTIEENHGHYITWDLYAAKANTTNTSSDTPGSESIPIVTSIPITTNQKAILYKIQ